MGEHGGEPDVGRAGTSSGDGWVVVAPGVHARAEAALPWARAQGGRASHGRVERGRPRLAVAAVVVAVVLLGAAGLARVAEGGGSATGLPAVAVASHLPEGTDDSGGPGGPSASGGTDGAGATGAPALPAGVGDTDWWAVLEVLDDRRAEVLESVDPAGLSAYAAPGSPAWRADEGLLASLAQAGTRPVGWGSELMAIESVAPCRDGASVCLEVVDRRGAYALVDAQGEAVQEVAQAQPQRWHLTLVAAGRPSAGEPGWRISEVAQLS